NFALSLSSRSLLETLTPVFPGTSLFRQIFRFPKDPTPVSSTRFPLDPRVALTRARAPRVADRGRDRRRRARPSPSLSLFISLPSFFLFLFFFSFSHFLFFSLSFP